MQVKVRDASEKRVAVINAGANDRSGDRVGGRVIKIATDVTESPKMVIDGFTDIRYMIRKGKMVVKSNTSDFNSLRGSDR